jgi:hypothetical protein
MTKTKTKQKILIITSVVVALILMAAVFYYLQQENELANDSVTEETAQSNNSSGKKDSDKNDDNNQDQDEKNVGYEITEFNKKDGDVFSVPDEITFNIAPAVKKTKITLKDSKGVVLYFEEKAISKGGFIIYPQGRLTEGSSGTLIIEGYDNNEVVIKKEVKVIF